MIPVPDTVETPAIVKEPEPLTLERVEFLSAKIADSASVLGLADKIRPLVDRASTQHREAIESSKNTAQAYKKRIEERKRAIARERERIKQDLEAQKKAKRELRKLERVKVTTLDTQPVVDRLRKHKAVQYVKVSPQGRLMVYMKPTYTMAQTSEHNRERVRMFAGCYLVTLTPGPYVDVSVKNLTFPRLSHGHWSVNTSGQPCWGDWQETANDLWQAGKLYEFITMMAAYLSSNEDGAAYSRTWKHRERRHVTVEGLATSSYQPSEGDYALLLSSYTDGNGIDLKYLPGIAFRGSSVGLHFLAPVHCNTYYESESVRTEGEYRDYWLGGERFLKLTPEQIADLVAYKKTIEGLPDTEKRAKLHEWGRKVAESTTIIDPETIKTMVLAHLDTADTVDYKTVAQPLKVKLKT